MNKFTLVKQLNGTLSQGTTFPISPEENTIIEEM